MVVKAQREHTHTHKPTKVGQAKSDLRVFIFFRFWIACRHAESRLLIRIKLESRDCWKCQSLCLSVRHFNQASEGIPRWDLRAAFLQCYFLASFCVCPSFALASQETSTSICLHHSHFFFLAWLWRHRSNKLKGLLVLLIVSPQPHAIEIQTRRVLLHSWHEHMKVAGYSFQQTDNQNVFGFIRVSIVLCNIPWIMTPPPQPKP